MARRHRAAIRAENQTLQERRTPGPGLWRRVGARAWPRQPGFVEGALVDQPGALARVGHALAHQLAEVDAIGEHLVDRALGPLPAAARAIGAPALLRDLADRIQLTRDRERRAFLLANGLAAVSANAAPLCTRATLTGWWSLQVVETEIIYPPEGGYREETSHVSGDMLIVARRAGSIARDG